MLAGPDWLKAHEGDLHGQDQTDDVEGAVGWRREKRVHDALITKDLKLILEEESLGKKKEFIHYFSSNFHFLTAVASVFPSAVSPDAA